MYLYNVSCSQCVVLNQTFLLYREFSSLAVCAAMCGCSPHIPKIVAQSPLTSILSCRNGKEMVEALKTVAIYKGIEMAVYNFTLVRYYSVELLVSPNH